MYIHIEKEARIFVRKNNVSVETVTQEGYPTHPYRSSLYRLMALYREVSVWNNKLLYLRTYHWIKNSQNQKNDIVNKWISNDLSAEKKQRKTRKREKNEEELMLKNKVPKKSGSVRFVWAIIPSSSLAPYRVHVVRVLWSYINLRSILINNLFFPKMCQWRQRREEAMSRSSHVTKAQNATKGSKSLLKCISHIMQWSDQQSLFLLGLL